MDNSGRKSPDGNKSFKSSTTKSTAEDKTENIKSNLEQNKNRSRSSKNKNKNFKKIDELKSAGASFISQYFKGFSTLERANIKADLDDDIPYRLIDVYQSSILSFCEWKSFSQAMDMGTKLDQQLFGAISLGMAIKLHQSSTDTEKKSNKLLSSLETKIILPKKLGVLIDQMGKSDIPGDNHFRIRNQNYAAKRHLARGIYNLIPKDKLTDYMEDNDYGTKFNDLVLIMEDPLIFPNMVDNSTWSHERIKQLGRSMYNKATSENFVFWKDKNEKDKNNVDPKDQFFMRFPKVDFDTLNLDAIGKILNNLVFTTFGYDTKTMTEMAAGLVLSIAKMAWIKQPTKNMEVLDQKFNGTWFEGKTFINVLAYCGIWNINYYLDDITLNNLALEAIRSWNTGYAKIFNSFLEMNEIPFGEHGSDAQLIQVDRSKLSKFKGIFDYNTRNFVKKAEATTVLKTNENNSLLGLMVGYTKNLSFESDWQLEFSSTNKGILYEFLKNDFKNNY